MTCAQTLGIMRQSLRGMKVPAMSLFELVRVDGRGGSISGGDSVRQVQIQSVDLDAHGGAQVLSDASLMSSMPAPCGHCHFRRYINAIKGKPSSANVNNCSANVIVAN